MYFVECPSLGLDLMFFSQVDWAVGLGEGGPELTCPPVIPCQGYMLSTRLDAHLGHLTGRVCQVSPLDLLNFHFFPPCFLSTCFLPCCCH